MRQDPEAHSATGMPHDDAAASDTDGLEANGEPPGAADVADDHGSNSANAGGESPARAPGAWDATHAPAADDAAFDRLIQIVVDALDSPHGDAFLRRIASGLADVDVTGGMLAPLLGKLQDELRHGADETDVLANLVDTLANDMADHAALAQAVPLLGALTARSIARGVTPGGCRINPDTGRRLVRAAFEAARQLVRDRGAIGAGPLPGIARGLVRHAARRGARVSQLADALPRIAARLVNDRGLARRLARSAAGAPASEQSWRRIAGGTCSLVLSGPTEITIVVR